MVVVFGEDLCVGSYVGVSVKGFCIGVEFIVFEVVVIYLGYFE